MRASDRHPWPGPLLALGLTALAVAIAVATSLAARTYLSPTATLGLSLVVGLGFAGALGAAYVPPPHAERLGLVRVRGRRVLAALLLTPAVLWAQQAGNWIRAAVPPPDLQEVVARRLAQVPTEPGVPVLETLIVTVGLAPLLEEWFFRGVIQQGLVARLGAGAGVAATALIFGLVHGSIADSPAAWSAAVAQGVVLGLAFGYARHATGSLSASIALHAATNLVSVLALAYAHAVPVPGFNAPAAHLSPIVLAAAATSMGLGIWWLSREAPPPIPVPPPPEPTTPAEDGF